MDDKLKLLLNLTSQLSSRDRVEVTLEKLSNATMALLEADICSIFLHDAASDELWSVVKHKTDQVIRVPKDKGIVGQVFTTREPLCVEDAYEHPLFNRDVDKATNYRTRSILALPLINTRDKTIGVVEVINKIGDGVFGPADVDLLKHVALFITSTIENNALYQELKSAQEAVIYKLSAATRFKDADTQNHTIRVGLYCALLASRLGWEVGETETLRLAAMMHDIGKVGIPDAILLKPGKFTDDEYELMKKHTWYGYEIMKGDDSHLSKAAAVIALEHHERWDGGGYPERKAGDVITASARMTKLADEFDALTSKRPYKEPWPLEKVMAHLQNERAKAFDPDLCDIFIANFDHMVQIKATYQD